ncbi:MAG: hypothetical protein M1368_05990 [Thaumarchaeota archaeon]|nr:hypothetical protein [Nitrososphaerota archaeon]
MKRVLVAIGLIVLVFGIMLSFYPPAFTAFGSITGLSSSKTIQDIHSGVVVKSNSFQDVPVVVTPNDNLSGSFQAGAPGVDFYLMDQGNYSVYRAGGGVFQYELAKLNVENYTFSFSNSASNQTVYLVFVSIPPATGNTDVLLNYKVIQDTSVS